MQLTFLDAGGCGDVSPIYPKTPQKPTCILILLGLFGRLSLLGGVFFFDLCSWHRALQRRVALLFKFRMRECLAWEHLIAHRGVIDESSLYGRSLGQILFL